MTLIYLVDMIFIVIFAVAGITKLGGNVWQRRQFAEIYHLPTWVRYVAGIEEVIGAGLLIAALFHPPLGLLATLWAALILTGWMITHSRIRNAFASPNRARLLLMLAIATLVLQFHLFWLDA